jgi:hypothetical protein
MSWMKNGDNSPAKNVCIVQVATLLGAYRGIASASSVAILGADQRRIQQAIIHSKQSSIASNYQRGRSHPIKIFTSERDRMRVKKAALLRYARLNRHPYGYSHATTAPPKRPLGEGPPLPLPRGPSLLSDLAFLIRSTDREDQKL